MRNLYQEQLHRLNQELIQMGAACEEIIDLAAQSLTAYSDKLEEKTNQVGAVIDESERTIETICLKLLLRQQPVASDLRQISAAMKMITDMERIGDQAEDIVDLIPKMSGTAEEEPLQKMAIAAQKMVTEAVDTITAAYTRRFALHQLTDTTSAEVGFICPRGAKFVPASVKLTFCVDRMVEKTVQVPVQQVNFPASKQLRTFPAKVNLTFQVGMSQYKHISADNFVLVVNYEDLLKSKGNTTRLSLKTIPTGVTHVRIRPQDVEFVIEDIPGYDSEDETE